MPRGLPAKPEDGATPPLRSQPTRDRIVAAARRLFAIEGFERTTIRAVAAAAGINPSMVMRYFISKEGLFAAASSFDLRLPDLAALPRHQIGVTLVRHFLERWESDEAQGELPALLRVAVTHEGARARLMDIFKAQVAPTVMTVCRPERSDECAALIGIQMLGMALTRDVLKLPPMVALPREVLIAQIGEVIQAYIEHAS